MLEGTLGEFALTDIFQLLALTKKSGALKVATPQAEGRVFFRGGEVYFAVSDTRRMPLGARLVSAELVTEEQLRAALEAREDSGTGRLAEVLLRDGTIDEGTLDQFVREQIQDAVFDLLRLTDGEFKFDANDDVDDAVGLTLATDQLILEGSRRLGEWSTIRERIPSAEAVVAIVPNPPSDGDQVTMTGEQWRMLALVDGSRTIAEIVDLTGQGEFATCQVLFEMISSGLVEVVDPDAGGSTGLASLLARRAVLRQLEDLELGSGKDKAKAAAKKPAADQAKAEESPKPEPEPAAEPAEAPAAEDDQGVKVNLKALSSEGKAPSSNGAGAKLTRDEEVNKTMLLRLIDGVKEA